jgi:hypothetical protein
VGAVREVIENWVEEDCEAVRFIFDIFDVIIEIVYGLLDGVDAFGYIFTRKVVYLTSLCS